MDKKRDITYSPVWLYRFFSWLERIPIPLWLFGVLVIIIGGLAMHLDAWRKGLVPEGEFHTYLASVSLFNVAFPAIWIFLDRRALLAMKDFFQYHEKGILKIDATYTKFISVPSLPANLVFLAGTIFGYIGFLSSREVQPLIGQVLPIWDMISWLPISGLMFLLVYRNIRQAFLLRDLFREIEVDIFNLSPVYALSRYASQVSVVFLVIFYSIAYTSLPEALTTSFGFSFQIFLICSLLIYFFAPLIDVNQQLRRSKEKLLYQIGKAQKNINTELLEAITNENYTELADLRNAVSTLKDQREVLIKLPTWPWQADTLRNLLTPLMLPIFVFIIQRYLGKFLGF